MSSATKKMKLKMKAEPQSPPNITNIEAVCPLIGVLANIPLQWNNNKGCFVGSTGFALKEQLSKRKGLRPLKVQVLCCGQRGHSGFALVFFDLLEQATMFEKSFQKSGCGKRDWNNNNALVCPSNKFLYGWIAGEDDFRFEGIVGQHLRKITGLNLKGVFDDMKEEEEKDEKTVLHSSSQGDGFSFLIDDLLKQKDEVVQRYHQDMGEAHDSAQKHLGSIISKREDVRVLLKQEIEMRNTALVVGKVLNKTQFRKIHKEKLMIENASLEQRKADDNLVLLLEKHKKQKEELHRGILEFEKGIEKKHMLELEMEQMKGALKVMKHMGDADGDGDDEEMVAKIESIQEGLKEKEQEYKYNRLEAMMSRCIKSDGEHDDYKPFVHVAKRMCFEDKEVVGLSLSSEWNKYLEDPTWNPFFHC
ncbi:hypothetical protein PIB30_020681 [Stylosanthes scabra]|uniref:XS domain-containing protein n=1 Tax=Stylosanthes scabra TaxID=79078 RepID=A0ABU6W8Q8_9FABA|nr:hypothetical protein [Stylosanthes scabra]